MGTVGVYSTVFNQGVDEFSAPYILPVIDNRPLVMKRMPNGADQPFFYQHRAPEPVPRPVALTCSPPCSPAPFTV